MTKEEQNQIIKDAWVRNLQAEKEIPSDIGSTYKNWLLGKIKQAASQLNTPQPTEEPQQDATQQQEKE